MLLASKRIEAELEAAPGCERYANVISGSREFWTLTIWSDPSKMREWMRDGTHGRVMWQQPHWLACYWGMRWRPGPDRAGSWEGRPWSWPDPRPSEPRLPQIPEPPQALPLWMDAALGRTARLEERQVAGAAGATYRLRAPLLGLPSALRDLRRLRRLASADPDSFTLSLGFGTGRALYLLTTATSQEALARLRSSPEHRRFLQRWGDRAWWSSWEPEAEFGQWESRRLRDGQLIDEPLLFDVGLPARSNAARQAREMLRVQLPELDSPSLDVLQLLTSEIVANSARHAGLDAEDRIGLQVRTKPDWVRVEVIDRGRRYEPRVPLSKSHRDGSGWGLFIVNQMADRWGVIERPGSRRMWFELRVPVAAHDAPATTRRFQGSFSARPEALAQIRSALRDWLAQRPIPPPQQIDLLIAVGEATANAAEHAYIGREPGEVYVELVDEDSQVVAHVRDFGRWRAPPAGAVRRGRGTQTMRSVSEGFRRETGPHGTTVTMCLQTRAQSVSVRT